jgi:putative SOS response-associated peptidase YedK
MNFQADFLSSLEDRMQSGYKAMDALEKGGLANPDEKRMVVILPEAVYGDWLAATPERSQKFLRPYPADRLVASAAMTAR